MKNLKVSIIQSDLQWESIEANLGNFEEKIWEINEPTDLIILPEMFTTGFSMKPKPLAELMNGKTHNWMRMIAAQRKAVVAGSCIITEKSKFFNRLLVVFPDGKTLHYDKKHLFTLGGEDVEFTPGKEQLTFDLNGWKIRTGICYDLRFPIWGKSKTTKETPFEYDLIFNVANWPAPRIHAWDVLLSARAIENISYSIGVNRLGSDPSGASYPGHSSAYNFKGEQLIHSKESGILNVTLEREALETFRKRYPFLKDSDQFELK